MKHLLAILLLFLPAIVNGQLKQNDFLLSFVDTIKDEYGYKNIKGDTIIPLGKYSICYTDTFRTYAIVLSDSGFVAIDRQENIMYYIFPFDNGPDYIHEGFFRIVDKGKVGFVSASSGQVVIKPQFDCAEPFNDGKAKVSFQCSKNYWVDGNTGKPDMDDPHFTYVSDEWFYINKQGKRVVNSK